MEARENIEFTVMYKWKTGKIIDAWWNFVRKTSPQSQQFRDGKLTLTREETVLTMKLPETKLTDLQGKIVITLSALTEEDVQLTVKQ